MVKLLLDKKVGVNIRVKDRSKDGGPTPLHIVALHDNHRDNATLLSDDRVKPLLKDAQDQVPREVAGNVLNRYTIIKMLEEAEKSYRAKPQKKAKNLTSSFKVEVPIIYHRISIYDNICKRK
ncbi:hypothetical protein CCY16_00504 [Wolbachia endosymbiont of Wuchereria bancrofti]|nr:hypothetical protein CCY16_00504 [Wolbachia endosymbiont of Wuchereria bancrofti]